MATYFLLQKCHIEKPGQNDQKLSHTSLCRDFKSIFVMNHLYSVIELNETFPTVYITPKLQKCHILPFTKFGQYSVRCLASGLSRDQSRGSTCAHCSVTEFIIFTIMVQEWYLLSFDKPSTQF